MSYRDYLEAQKKYIETKKEAKQLKEERLRNPKPPRLDPPPAPTSRLLIFGLVLLAFLPIIIMSLILPLSAGTTVDRDSLTIWVLGTEEEFRQIKNWLEPEILANELEWEIEHLASRRTLQAYLNSGLMADLLVADADLAEEMYLNRAAAPLWPKREGNVLDDLFSPLWEPKPFRKTLGWIIPRQGRVDDARHLFTVLRQFAAPFKP